MSYNATHQTRQFHQPTCIPIYLDDPQKPMAVQGDGLEAGGRFYMEKTFKENSKMKWMYESKIPAPSIWRHKDKTVTI